jgi:DNA-binding response OmpR family regulator
VPMILLIEDDPMQRLAPTFTLEKAGFEVQQAETAEQGLSMALARKPDLIVCDVLMPGMNGFQFVAAVRANELICEVPIIMLTSLAERNHMRTGMTSGADDYLVKPLIVQELREAVVSLLAKRKTQQEKLQDMMETELVQALDQQRDSLGAQYENRLVEELNTRWVRQDGANTELHYRRATLLRVDMLRTLSQAALLDDEAINRVRKRFHQTRDTLYLFGARHLLPYGNQLLAIFTAETGARGTTPTVRALRAAFALVKAAGKPSPGQRGLTVALHEGPVTLVEISDPLHGDPDSTLATGDAVTLVESLAEFAGSLHWPVAVTGSMAQEMDEVAVTGRRERWQDSAATWCEAVELISVS